MNFMAKFVHDIKSGGEFVSENSKLACKERATLIAFNLINEAVLFSTMKTFADRSEFPLKRTAIKFLTKFISSVATGDTDPLNKYFKRHANPELFEQEALRYAQKCRSSIFAVFGRYTDENAFRAQRVAATRSSNLHIREDVKANVLFALFETAYTYRLCKYVRVAANFPTPPPSLPDSFASLPHRRKRCPQKLLSI